MPDLQSELAKLACSWDDHENTIRTPNQTQPKQENKVPSINTTSITTTTTHTPAAMPPGKSGAPIRNNVMRTCFDTLWQHPGKTAKQLTDMLAAQGYKVNSTTAVFSQLVRTGQAVRGDDGTLHPNPAVKTYRPITLPTARAVERRVKKEVKKAVPSAGIAALKSDTATATTLTLNTDLKGVSRSEVLLKWTPESVLEKLTLPQAKQLYAALKEYFA